MAQLILSNDLAGGAAGFEDPANRRWESRRRAGTFWFGFYWGRFRGGVVEVYGAEDSR